MTTPTREQVVQWAKQAWDDTGEGWTNSRWFDERAPSFEAFATLARADLEAESERLKEQVKVLTEALEPFSRLLQEHHERLPDSQPIYGIGDALITVGDMRKALAAVKELK